MKLRTKCNAKYVYRQGPRGAVVLRRGRVVARAKDIAALAAAYARGEWR